MRRPQNYGYEPVPQNQSDDLEIENEKLAEDLKNKISSLKSLTIDIGEYLTSSVENNHLTPVNLFQAMRCDIKTRF